MLRWVVALLLVANAAFYAWSRGWLDPVIGSTGQGEREPERMARQVRPEIVKLLPRRATSAAVSAADARTACMEAGPIAEADVAAAVAALRAAGVAPGRWEDIAQDQPGAWLVYMGRFTDRDMLQRKRAELQRIRVAFEGVHAPPELDAGLSLGRFGDRSAADAALSQFAQRGVRTAHVVTVAASQRLHLLRADQADAALQRQLQGLKSPALGTGFKPCAVATS